MTNLHLIAEAILIAVGRASWHAALVIPLAWLVCRVLHRTPRRIHCWIWRLAYLKIVVAVIWVSPISVPLLPSTESTVVTFSFESIESFVENSRIEVSDAGIASPPRSHDWIFLLVGAWCLGFGWFTFRFINEWRFAIRVRRTASSCNIETVIRSYRQASEDIGLALQPRLLVTNDLPVPALVGIRSPAVVIPDGFVERVNSEELSLVLRHELCHFKRADLLWNLLPRLVESALFFHPFIWLASRRWKLSQEAACDELVMEHSDAQERIYAQTLLKVARLSPTAQRSSLATIGVVGSFRSLKERLTVMQNSTAWSRKAYAAAASVAVLVSCLGIVPWKLVAQQPSGESVADAQLATDGDDQNESENLLRVMEDTKIMTPQVEFLRSLGISEITLNDKNEIDGVIISGKHADQVLAYLAIDKTVTNIYLGNVAVSPAGLETLGTLKNLKQLHLMNLPETRFNDDSFQHLANLKQLDVLSLQGMKVNGSGFKHLVGLKKLRDLGTRGCAITEDSLKHVRQFSGLQHLFMSGAKVQSLENLRGMKSLKFLDLQNTRVDDAGMAALSSLPNLTNLTICNSPVQGSGLKHVANVENKLCYVVLNGQQFRQGVQHLKEIDALHLLSITKSELEDVDTKLFKGFRNLKSIDISGSNLTDRGTVNIRKLLPDVDVRNRRKTSKS